MRCRWGYSDALIELASGGRHGCLRSARWPAIPSSQIPHEYGRWEQHVGNDADLATLLHEATGHAVALRDALNAGAEPTSVTQDHSLMLVSVTIGFARSPAFADAGAQAPPALSSGVRCRLCGR